MTCICILTCVGFWFNIRIAYDFVEEAKESRKRLYLEDISPEYILKIVSS